MQECENRCKSVRTLHRCMICSSLLHDTHTAVLINTAVLILHCRTIYQKKKPTGTIIPMSFSSLFTLLFFSTPSSSCQPNYLLRLLFLCFYGRKLEVWNEKRIGRLVTGELGTIFATFGSGDKISAFLLCIVVLVYHPFSYLSISYLRKVAQPTIFPQSSISSSGTSS